MSAAWLPWPPPQIPQTSSDEKGNAWHSKGLHTSSKNFVCYHSLNLGATPLLIGHWVKTAVDQ